MVTGWVGTGQPQRLEVPEAKGVPSHSRILTQARQLKVGLIDPRLCGRFMNRSVTWASRTFSGKWIPGTSNSISVFRTEVCFVLLNSDRMYEIRGFTRYPFPSVVFCIFFCGWKLLCRTGFYTFG